MPALIGRLPAPSTTDVAVRHAVAHFYAVPDWIDQDALPRFWFLGCGCILNTARVLLLLGILGVGIMLRTAYSHSVLRRLISTPYNYLPTEGVQTVLLKSVSVYSSRNRRSPGYDVYV